MKVWGESWLATSSISVGDTGDIGDVGIYILISPSEDPLFHKLKTPPI